MRKAIFEKFSEGIIQVLTSRQWIVSKKIWEALEKHYKGRIYFFDELMS